MDTKFKPGQSGNPNGRPKGAKDGLSQSAKQNIEKAFEKLGGVDALVEWGGKNQRNQGLLYGWYFKMLPSNVSMEHSGEIKAMLSMTDLKKSLDEYIKSRD